MLPRVALVLVLGLGAVAAVVAACTGTDPDLVPGVDGGTGTSSGGPGASGGDGRAPPVDGDVDAGDAAPALTCTTPEVACGSKCVDPATFVNDSANCGACGHDCGADALCSGSHCQVATIWTGPGDMGHEIVSIAVDATSIYFDAPAGDIGTTHGSVGKCPLSRCTAPAMLYDFPYAEVDMLLTSPSAPGFVYYTDNADDHTFRLKTDGSWDAGAFPGTTTDCASQAAHCAVDQVYAGGHPYALASDGDRLFIFRNYAHAGAGGIAVKLPTGASGVTFGDGPPLQQVAALGLALDPSDPSSKWLYIAGEAGLWAVEPSVDTTVPVKIADPPTSPYAGGIAVGNHLVLATYSGGVRSTGTCPASDVCTQTIANDFAVTPGAEAMVGDGTNVYWSATDHIYTCPFTGCVDAPTPIADLRGRVRAMAIDSKNVYWGDDRGALYRIAK